jgi:DNA-binding transcriptional regulator YiaG
MKNPRIKSPDVPLDGARIQRIRQALHLTQEAFAHEIGTSFAAVNRWENDHNKPCLMARKILWSLEKRLFGKDKL